jgi:uncharacterized protein YdeI (YjbR/CyaY-like superfamily)
MEPSGQALVDAAKADGTWSLLDGVENLQVPADLADALSALPGSADTFSAFPRSVRRGILEWIVTAKTPTTRSRRVGETAVAAAAGERAHQQARRR